MNKLISIVNYIKNQVIVLVRIVQFLHSNHHM